MRILKGAITSLASQGRITLQIPQYDLWIDKDVPRDEDRYEEIPDDWVIFLRHGAPTVGKEKGYLFLTRKGWEENKDKIEEAFANSGMNRRGSWNDFERHVEHHFDQAIRKTQRKRQLLETKLSQLEEALEKL